MGCFRSVRAVFGSSIEGSCLIDKMSIAPKDGRSVAMVSSNLRQPSSAAGAHRVTRLAPARGNNDPGGSRSLTLGGNVDPTFRCCAGARSTKASRPRPFWISKPVNTWPRSVRPTRVSWAETYAKLAEPVRRSKRSLPRSSWRCCSAPAICSCRQTCRSETALRPPTTSCASSQQQRVCPSTCAA